MTTILTVLLLTTLFFAVDNIGIPYYFMKRNSDVMIDFHTFLSMYKISPDSYELKDTYNTIYYDGVSRRYKIGIRFPGYVRFIFWLSSKQKEEIKKREVLAAANLMEDWKRDIERKKDEHGEE